jgi:type I restriction enzyme S subunit
MKAVTQRITKTGGREATTRHIPPKLALAVGMPLIPPPKGWRWASLTDIARLESGHTPSRRHPEWWGGSIPWIGIKDARANDGACIDDTQEKTNERGIEHSAARVLPANTVCLSRTASVGYVVVMGRPMATSQDFVNWVCSDHLDHNFLKYIFIAEGDELLRFASGSVHQTIYFPEVKAFHVCLPQLPEQQRIVGILDEAFDGIATAKVNAEKNLQNARALFESHLQSAFTQQSGGWQHIRLGEMVERLTNGYVGPTRNIYCETGIPYLLARHVKRNRLNFDGRTFISQAFNLKARKSILKTGDVLLVQSGHIGHSAVVPPEHEGHNCHAMIVITPVANRLDGKFLSWFFGSPNMQRHFESMRTGSTLKHLNCRDVIELQVPAPSLTTQHRIVAKFESLTTETQRLESIYQQKLAALEALKKSLLHQAFTGEL